MAVTPKLIIICEGKSEQNFVNYALKSYFQRSLTSWQIEAQLLGEPFRPDGGNPTYVDLRDHIKLVLEQYPNAFITTFLDYYELGKGFGLGHLSKIKQENISNDIYLTVECLEEEATKKLAKDIAILKKKTFIPYIQLHEFEMLYFADVENFYRCYNTERLYLIKNDLLNINQEIDNPELINNKKETSPANRIAGFYDKTGNRPFEKTKATFALMFAQTCNIEHLRTKCRHFNDWLSKLESLKLMKE
jgi:hypothetical protein